MTGAQRGDFGRPTNPQPGERDGYEELRERSKVNWPGKAFHLNEPITPAPYAPASSEEACEHRDTWFDRVVCPEPCGGMHEHCADCGHTLHGCLNDPPAPSAGQDTGQLRDEIERLIADDQAIGWQESTPSELTDLILELPSLRRLIAERDEARGQVQRVAELVEAYDDGELWSSQVVDFARRALDGQP